MAGWPAIRVRWPLPQFLHESVATATQKLHTRRGLYEPTWPVQDA
jgi:hypothetical protein